MGMYDESWCNSCGCSQPYSNEEVTCGKCMGEEMESKSLEVFNYIKLHLISLEQDSEKLEEQMSQFEYDMDSKEYETLEIEDISTNGQIIATRHLLSVVAGILGIQTKEQ